MAPCSPLPALQMAGKALQKEHATQSGLWAPSTIFSGRGGGRGSVLLHFLQDGEVSSLGPTSFQSSMSERLLASPQRSLVLVPGFATHKPVSGHFSLC